MPGLADALKPPANAVNAPTTRAVTAAPSGTNGGNGGNGGSAAPASHAAPAQSARPVQQSAVRDQDVAAPSAGAAAGKQPAGTKSAKGGADDEEWWTA